MPTIARAFFDRGPVWDGAMCFFGKLGFPGRHSGTAREVVLNKRLPDPRFLSSKLIQKTEHKGLPQCCTRSFAAVLA